MANVNLPPQAYTRDTLTQAFEWLHQQPDNVRETAGSIDSMVAMFLQAKRRGQLSGSDLASAQSFKNDLKHLAEDLKKFETPAAAQQAAPSPSYQMPVQPAQPPPQSMPSYSQAYHQAAPIHVPVQVPVQSQTPTTYDPKTMDSIETVREAFNLSSDNEALRLLVSLGFEHIRQILPKT